MCPESGETAGNIEQLSFPEKLLGPEMPLTFLALVLTISIARDIRETFSLTDYP